MEIFKNNRTYIFKRCDECKKEFEVLKSEFKRGGGKFCSRICYYENLKKTRPRGENSWAWKGDKVKKAALHNWVERELGKPQKCEHCETITAQKYEWANKSQKYKREISDWMRLCTKCHWAYDYEIRITKWKKAVKKLGWKIKI